MIYSSLQVKFQGTKQNGRIQRYISDIRYLLHCSYPVVCSFNAIKWYTLLFPYNVVYCLNHIKWYTILFTLHCMSLEWSTMLCLIWFFNDITYPNILWIIFFILYRISFQWYKMFDYIVHTAFYILSMIYNITLYYWYHVVCSFSYIDIVLRCPYFVAYSLNYKKTLYYFVHTTAFVLWMIADFGTQRGILRCLFYKWYKMLYHIVHTILYVLWML